ncbi:hypothetical protein ES703_81270 [subsurface metagenome]
MGREYRRLVTILGSVPVADQILIHDDFSGLLKWSKADGVGDAIFEIDPTIAYKGNQSLRMKTRTVGASEYDVISAERSIFMSRSKVLSFSIPFYLPSLTTQKRVQFSFQWTDDTDNHSCILQYDPSVPEWNVNTASGVQTPIPGSDFDLYAATWHLMILKANFAADNYISLQVDHLLFDLSTLPMYAFGSPTDIRLQCQLQILANGAAPTEIYFGEILVHEL